MLFYFDLCCTDVSSDDSKLLRCVHLDMWSLNFSFTVFELFYFDLCCTDVSSDDSKLLRCVYLDMWSLNFDFTVFE